jgi:hypothetical protein
MAPLRVSTTKSEWLPDDPTAFVPTRLWKLPFITTWDDSRNQNRPTDSAEEAYLYRAGEFVSGRRAGDRRGLRTLKRPRLTSGLSALLCRFLIRRTAVLVRGLK